VSRVHPHAAIRIATPDDVAALAALNLASWRAAYRGIVPDAILMRLTPESRIARWQRTFAAPESGFTETTIAVEGDRPIGLCSFGPRLDPRSSSSGEIYSLHVQPELRREGIGTLLLDDALRRLRGRGFDGAVLWVLRDDADARRFYESQGWASTGEARVDDRDGYAIPETGYAIGVDA
jgi:ribosomal protein S18 acetylase RimI-like enzyme